MWELYLLHTTLQGAWATTTACDVWAKSSLKKRFSLFCRYYFTSSKLVLNLKGWQIFLWLMGLNNHFCYTAGNFFPNSARSHWLLRSHMISNNETVSRQNLWAGNIVKSMTLRHVSALLWAKVDWRPPLQRGLMYFQLQNFQLYNKSLKVWPIGKQLILFPSNFNVSETNLTVSLRTSHL